MKRRDWHDRLAAMVRGCSAAGLLFAVPALAQQPSSAQIGAIRAHCRADYRAMCAAVPTGGPAALNCLRQNAPSLSPSCRAAVDAVGGGKPGAPQQQGGMSPRQQGAMSPTPSQQAAAAQPAQWPHAITVDGNSVVIYQPQVIEWPGKTRLTARAAIEITPAGGKPFLGTIDVVGDTVVDFDTSSVLFSNPRLLASHFPSLDTERAARVEARIRAALGSLGVKTIPLDTVLLGLAPGGVPAPEAAVSNVPPRIFFSDHPAVLLAFDGDPVMVPVQGTTLTHAVNGNWTVIQDPATRGWYVLTNGVWSMAADYRGPWSAAASLPPAFDRLPADAGLDDARRAIASPSAGPPPAILVSTVPAAIIVTEGAPAFAPIPPTRLSYVSNTPSDLFRAGDGQFYVLLSGRWFASASLDGPWHFATPELPLDFQLIPEASPRARVLASVPGAQAAQLAVLQAQIPRQATLSRATTKVAVSYAGPPVFRPIPGTTMQHAVNSPYGVIRVGNVYYLCWQGAWFRAPTPSGPWLLAASVPPVIYTIPPSSPLYPVTYVRVYAVTPATVTYGYTSGYAMGFVSSGVLIYGTGYVYPPVVIAAPVPIYFPYPATYGGGYVYSTASGAYVHGGAVYGPYYGARGGSAYNPATGAYAHGGAVYGPYGGAAGFSAYNPSTGSYAQGSASWGAYGGTANASFYNAHTGVSGSTSQNSNAYGRWGSSQVSGPNQTVNSASGANSRGSAGGFTSTTGAQGAGVHGANGNKAGAVRTSNGDVYAGANGNVYQHSASGWSKYNNGAWTPVQQTTKSGTRSGTNPGTNPSSSSRASSRGAYGASSGGGWGASATGSQVQRDYTARQQGGAQSWGQRGGGQRWGGGGQGWGGGRFAGGGSGGGRFHR